MAIICLLERGGVLVDSESCIPVSSRVMKNTPQRFYQAGMISVLLKGSIAGEVVGVVASPTAAPTAVRPGSPCFTYALGQLLRCIAHAGIVQPAVGMHQPGSDRSGWRRLGLLLCLLMLVPHAEGSASRQGR